MRITILNTSPLSSITIRSTPCAADVVVQSLLIIFQYGIDFFASENILFNNIAGYLIKYTQTDYHKKPYYIK